ncbi:MAG: hypothetical protein ABI228_04155 [Burkholderiaceae bacterium]
MNPENWSREEWLDAFADVINRTKLIDERVDDITAGCISLGERRATLLGREFDIGEDTSYALCLFCWWPFKSALTSDSRHYLQEIRTLLFQGVSHSERRLHDLNDAVPDQLLKMELSELFSHLRRFPASEVITVRIPASGGG